MLLKIKPRIIEKINDMVCIRPYFFLDILKVSSIALFILIIIKVITKMGIKNATKMPWGIRIVAVRNT